MPTVFVAGSIKIKRLHPLFVERIVNIVREGMPVIVGDADGADASVQAALVAQSAPDVTVYCTGDKPRNNLGNWNVHRVRSSEHPGTRAYFVAKDIEMAKRAEFGLMLWDAASTGTLSNVLELMAQGKKSVVFINRETRFLNVKNGEDLLDLVSYMSDGARTAADRKIRLDEKISRLTSFQYQMPV
ncbi:hypothetical protein CX676_05755 [Paracoccus zhejiangensis]|uniref:Uncharacterized protein n=2 Tax=Paracoccus zhejiangensis TaxID=1077935 RepID=A0A2H5F3S0_9RHOB|nr:hypothetical protein CX676_05755 [Paracoccus zhejiangensis]